LDNLAADATILEEAAAAAAATSSKGGEKEGYLKDLRRASVAASVAAGAAAARDEAFPQMMTEANEASASASPVKFQAHVHHPLPSARLHHHHHKGASPVGGVISPISSLASPAGRLLLNARHRSGSVDSDVGRLHHLAHPPPTGRRHHAPLLAAGGASAAALRAAGASGLSFSSSVDISVVPEDQEVETPTQSCSRPNHPPPLSVPRACSPASAASAPASSPSSPRVAAGSPPSLKSLAIETKIGGEAFFRRRPSAPPRPFPPLHQRQPFSLLLPSLVSSRRNLPSRCSPS